MAIRMFQGDLFVANIEDVRTKHSQELMAINWFSLSKKGRKTSLRYEWDDGASYFEVKNDTEHAIASVWDADILLFCISVLVDKINRGEEISNELSFYGADFLYFIGRRTRQNGGRAYLDIWNKLQRLHTTRVTTSVRKVGQLDWSFYWLADIKQGIDEQGRHRGYKVRVADWIVDSVRDGKRVLTLDNDYFTLTGGLEKWLYLWMRKSAGRQNNGWMESFYGLWKKSGSEANYNAFVRQIRQIILKNDGLLLDYHMNELIVKRSSWLEVIRLSKYQLSSRRKELGITFRETNDE
jgi:plasmid replication initiation protein